MTISVALDAPGSLVKPFCTDRPYQMMLAGCLLDPKQGPYQTFYHHTRGMKLLDNGAWETETLEAMDLIELALDYQAHEVIAPDVLNDCKETYRLTEAFLQTWRKHNDFLSSTHARHHHFRVIAVAHGASMSEAMSFVRAIDHLNDTFAPLYRIRTIGIGRAFSRSIGDPLARYRLAQWMRDHYGHVFECHLLGFNDDLKVGELHGCTPLVRSMDTAAPFTAALAGRTLQEISPSRQPEYFYTEYEQYDLELVKHNVDQLDRWAAGK